MEYFQQENYEEGFEFGNSQFVDRSAQLNATLNSLAMMNVANIIKKNKLDKSKLEENEELKNKKEHDFLVDKIPGWEDYKDENDDFLYVD